ncbi:MAG: expansin EXLX1 family cellulose-binding protein [Porcipelethomonas sp.]
MKKGLKTLLAVVMAGCICIGSVSAAGAELDVNSSGEVNSLDMAAMRRNPQDLNGDGIIDDSDFSLLSDFILGKDTDEYSIDESAILEPKGTIHYGEGTFYGGGYEGGCAMLDPISREDYWIVAMNLADYNNAQLAGAYIEVTGELGTINMLVTDLLPEGKKGDLDLYTDAFPLIAPVEKGRVPVSWRIIPLDSAENAPVSFKFKEGSSEFWCGVQVRNHRYPVTKLEYLNEDGEYVELPRRLYNFFESDEMGPGPFTFRITDIYGQVIVDRDIPLVPDQVTEGHVQFPK